MSSDSPKWLMIDSENPDSLIIQKAADAICQGGVLVLPTDTAYGLAGNPTDPVIVSRIIDIKERKGKAGMPVLAANFGQVLNIAKLEDKAHDLANKFWPGGLTLILQARHSFPEGVQGPTGSLAVRIPDHPVALEIISEVGFAVTGTSANKSGEPSPYTAADAYSQVGNQVDIIIDAGRTRHCSVSTIVDCTEDPPRLIRRGVISEKVIDAALNE